MRHFKHSLPLLFVLAIIALSIVPPVAAQGGEILVVTNTQSETTSGGCDADCSFLDAILASESMNGVQEIHFDIPGSGVVHTILTPLTTALPQVGFRFQKSVIVDATTQPGYVNKPLIRIIPALSSTENGMFVEGIFTYDPTLTVTIRGFDLTGFTKSGAICLCNGQNHLIEKNFIGVDPTGLNAVPNLNGIIVNSPSNIIRDNVISGNSVTGIALSSNHDGRDSNNNQVLGNFIGTDFSGTVAIPNQYGVAIRYGSHDNRIGGTTPADRNIISNNSIAGIYMDGRDDQPENNTNSTTITGNYIGTDKTGTQKMANGMGVLIERSDDNVIGGTTGTTPGGSCTGACNLISGNNGVGIGITESVLGTSENNLVLGNFIGTDVTGTLLLGNTGDGITIGSSLNTIGGTTPQARNLISGNGSYGISISGLGAYQNEVLGNYIGTDTTGLDPLGNSAFGIYIVNSAYANQIGDGTDGGANWIAYNGKMDNQGGIGIDGGLSQGYYVEQNRISRNSFFGNYRLAIDLGNDGVTPNDAGDGDTGANNNQNNPIVTSVVTRTNTVINGTLNSVPNRAYRVELYASPQCDDSGYGEGDTFIGGDNVTTNGSGNAVFQSTIDPSLPAYAAITTLAIDEDSAANSGTKGNTSEFSECQYAETDLSLTKTDSIDPAVPGGDLTYTLTITNAADGSYAENTVLTDLLPLGLNYVSANTTQGSCSFDTPNRTVNCSLGDVINSGIVTVTINTTLDANITKTSLENTASVISDTYEADLENNLATQSTQIARANIRLTMTDLPDPVTVDAFLTYNLAVTNLGPTSASGVAVNDTLPANVTFIAATASQGSCTPTSGTVTCNLGSLGNAASASVTIVVQPLPATQNTTITNTAIVSALAVDTVPANNTVTALTKVNPSTGIPMTNFYTTSTPVLTWNPITWAAGYQVQVDDNATFTSPEFDNSSLTASDLSVMVSLTHDGMWYWRVRAKDIAGKWGAWSTVTIIVVDAP